MNGVLYLSLAKSPEKHAPARPAAWQIFRETLINQNPVGATDADGRQEAALSRFFWLYSAAHAWFIGIDHLIGNGWTFSPTMSALLAS